MKKRIFCVLVLIVQIFSIFCLEACGMNDKESNNQVNTEGTVYELSDMDFTYTQLAGTDALGRRVEPMAGIQEDKFTSIFFFVWFGTHTTKIYDINKLLEQYENGIRGNLENPLWAVPGSEYYNSSISPYGEFHYWGEPLLGYYDASDPWVIRKQLEMLGNAQVDCLMLDFTNNIVYPEATKAILDIMVGLRSSGYKVPQIAFMLPAVSTEWFENSLNNVYKEYVSNEKYKDCFFRGSEKINPSGLPLAVGNCEEYDGELKEKFWIKRLQWAWMDIGLDNFPAMSETVKQINHNGYMSVTTEVYSSENSVSDITWCSTPYLYPDRDLMRGRGWYPGDTTNGDNPENVAKGLCFQDQWNNVFADGNVDFVHMQCWNEWWAQKFDYMQDEFDAQRAVFVDAFNDAFSRDIEPVNGRLGDNYYMQMVQNIRKFKQTAEAKAVEHGKTTIDIKQGFEQWKKVKGNYLDLEDDVIFRDYNSVDPQIRYTDNSARNDIVRLKFANDEKNLYVLVETAADITSYTANDKAWMNLYISTGKAGGWEYYNYVINRNPLASGSTSIEELKGEAAETTNVGTANYYVEGRRIYYSIPLSVLGVKVGEQIEIKATDNVQNFGKITDFYVSGDSAPMGRLNYAYLLA